MIRLSRTLSSLRQDVPNHRFLTARIFSTGTVQADHMKLSHSESATPNTTAHHQSKQYQKWSELASKEIKQPNIDQLTWHTAEGIAVKPLYLSSDIESINKTLEVKVQDELPGVYPYTRGMLYNTDKTYLINLI